MVKVDHFYPQLASPSLRRCMMVVVVMVVVVLALVDISAPSGAGGSGWCCGVFCGGTDM
jgi:hypothetical protein